MALEMQRFLLDTLSPYPSCLFCYKEQSVMMKFGGTGVLPSSTQKGQPWMGVGRRSNCSFSYKSTALAPGLVPALIAMGKWHFSEFPKATKNLDGLDIGCSILGLNGSRMYPNSQTQTCPLPPHPNLPTPGMADLRRSELGNKERKGGPRVMNSPCLSVNRILDPNCTSSQS